MLGCGRSADSVGIGFALEMTKNMPADMKAIMVSCKSPFLMPCQAQHSLPSFQRHHWSAQAICI